jgi:uncharacterized protein YgbK (DUF1537 family)
MPWTLLDGDDASAIDHRLGALLRPNDGGEGDTRMVLWDAARAAHLDAIGRALWQRACEAPLLAVGPSSVVEAVAGAMPTKRGAPVAQRIDAARGPVLVLAGSLSPVTARQVAAARSFDIVRLDAARLAKSHEGYLAGLAADLADRLASGRHVLACTVVADDAGVARADIASIDLARAGGRLLARTLAATPVARLGIAGGDTSSWGVRALDAWGLAYAGLVAPGAPLCRLCSDDSSLDGMEVMLKGGQMGGDDLFERLVHGSGDRAP